MRWQDWEPTYRAIRAEFGYDKADDERARDILRAMLMGRYQRDAREAFRLAVRGREVWIAGGATTPESLALVPPDAPFLVSDGAAGVVLPRRRPTAIVTDLDGDVDAQREANAGGVPLFVHAHGDNVPALEAWVPTFAGPVFGTTQAAPLPPAFNHGGFTDGDRAASLAADFGAARLALVGFDYERPVVKPGVDPEIKRRKLAWARRIVEGLRVPVRYADVSSSTQR